MVLMPEICAALPGSWFLVLGSWSRVVSSTYYYVVAYFMWRGRVFRDGTGELSMLLNVVNESEYERSLSVNLTHV